MKHYEYLLKFYDLQIVNYGNFYDVFNDKNMYVLHEIVMFKHSGTRTGPSRAQAFQKKPKNRNRQFQRIYIIKQKRV